MTRLQYVYVYRYLHSTALHLAGAELERILQISDLETLENYYRLLSPTSQDVATFGFVYEGRPDLPQRVVKPLGGWRQNRRSSLRLHYRRGSTCGTNQNGRLNGRRSDVNIRPSPTTPDKDDEEEGDKE